MASNAENVSIWWRHHNSYWWGGMRDQLTAGLYISSQLHCWIKCFDLYNDYSSTMRFLQQEHTVHLQIIEFRSTKCLVWYFFMPYHSQLFVTTIKKMLTLSVFLCDLMSLVELKCVYTDPVSHHRPLLHWSISASTWASFIRAHAHFF